jgi:nucleoside-diphosphate-sugar epimerase
MRWFITGADRFVGRYIAKAALARGDEVVAVVRDVDASKSDPLSQWESKLVRVSIDWDHNEADEALCRAMAGCDVIAHSDLGNPWSTDRRECERSVLVRVEQLIDAGRRAKVPRFILRSSERVTSSGVPRRMVDESLGHSDRWLSPWDEMLAVAEGLVCALTTGMEGIALRAAFVWGPGDDESLPRFRSLSQKKRLTLPGGGSQSFCTTHVANLAHAFLCAADAGSEVAGNAYWVLDEEMTSARRFLTRWLVTAGEKGPKSGLLPYAVARFFTWINERSGGMSRSELALVSVALSVNTQRTRAALGYQPKLTIDEGMQQMLEEQA